MQANTHTTYETSMKKYGQWLLLFLVVEFQMKMQIIKINKLSTKKGQI